MMIVSYKVPNSSTARIKSTIFVGLGQYSFSIPEHLANTRVPRSSTTAFEAAHEVFGLYLIPCWIILDILCNS